MKSEKDLQSNILDNLEYYTPDFCFSFKIMKTNKPGIQDIFVVSMKGCFLIEVKKERTGIESHAQIYVRNTLKKFYPIIKTFVVSTWQQWVKIREEHII